MTVTQKMFDPQKMSTLLLSNILKKLNASEREMRTLADNISAILIRFDRECRFLYVNKRFKLLMRMGFSDLRGKKPTDILGLPDTEFFEQTIRRIIETGVAESFEHEATLPDGRIRTGVVNVTPEHDAQGRVLYVQLLIRDITEQKRLETALKTRELEFRSLAENTPDNIARWDTQGRYLYINPVHERTLGKSRSEVIGTFIPNAHEAVKAAIAQVAATGEKIMISQTVPTKDGNVEYHEVSLVAERDISGNIVSVLGIGRDITEQKKLELALKEKQERLETIIENTPECIKIIDAEGHLVYMNPAGLEMIEATLEQVRGKEVLGVVVEEYRDSFLQMHRRVIDGEKVHLIFETIGLRGKHCWLETTSVPMQMDGKSVLLGVTRDITEKRASEKMLHLLINAIDAASESFFLIQTERPDFYYVNDTAAKTLGYTKEELTNGMGVLDIDPDFNDMSIWIEHVETLEKSSSVTFETRHRSKEGRIYPVEIRSTFFIYNNERLILSITRDISQEKETEKALFTREHEFRNLSENSPNIIIRYDRNYRKTYVNQAFAYQTGISIEQAIHSQSESEWDNHLCLLTMSVQEYQERIQQVIESGEADYFTMAWYRLSDGEYVAHEFYLAVEQDMDGNSIGVLAIGHDITERQKNEALLMHKESRLKEAQKIAKVGSWELEYPSQKLIWSDEIYSIFEIEQKDQPPRYSDFLNALHPQDRALVNTHYSESLKSKLPYDTVHRLLLSDGRIKYVHEKGITHYDSNGNPIRSIGTVQDITNQKTIEKRIEHMAHHDALTGLPNRILAKDRTDQAIAHAKRHNTTIALLFIDLDEFKTINDSLGHSAGDTTLQIIASRLKKCIRESDIISRQGGDEFLIILTDIEVVNNIITITEKLLQEFEKPFLINNQPFSTSASIGIATYPANGDNFELLLKNADTAMYKAKESGKNTYCFYTEQMNHNLIGQLKIQHDLKNGLANGEFILFYQPQIDLASNHITGVEALIRWNHPLLGMMPPMSFIPIAESSGLIVPIGEWVIYEACRQAAAWHTMGIEITVAVNISAVQFKRGNLESLVKNALKTSGLHPYFLELELTESILINDVENILKTVQALKALGIQLSIDDFGTGYSSLSYLKRFAVDKLKIDQSFVRDILSDQEDAAIVKTIIQMAKCLNLKTIAEGVENELVLRVIDSYGCDEVQGYHFAKPMKTAEFESYYYQFNTTTPHEKELLCLENKNGFCR